MHILLVGYNTPIFTEIMVYVRDICNYKISFIVRSESDVKSVLSSDLPIENIFILNDGNVKEATSSDLNYLKSLEEEDVSTINNMIMGDPSSKKLPFKMSLNHASYLSGKFNKLYKEINPSVVIGCHDCVHSGIGCAVAKSLDIPWFALTFCPLPSGYVALREGLIPDRMVSLRDQDYAELSEFCIKFLNDFKNNNIKPPAYISAHNFKIVSERIPKHLNKAILSFKKTYFGGLNKYLEFDFKFLVRQYLRKRKNLLTFPKKLFINNPPNKPYIFFGLHMQPENTIDVYAPFYSNQFAIIETISRSIPPTHTLLVKLHISDADNYSRSQLKFLSNLPGVQLVSPSVASRDFINNSSTIITITGNMGLEGALLGKPVLIFGKRNYEHFPSVTRIGNVEDLPSLIRKKLSEKAPDEDSIIEALIKYINPYFKAASNHWIRESISNEEKDGFVNLFQHLEKHLEKQ